MITPIQKILFICSSLEPGKDGVGDYTRKLACALQNKGYVTAIMAINDRRIPETWRGIQCDESVEISVLRIPATLSWPQRLSLIKAFANDFKPGWISLQYVPFGFQIKGLPFRLADNLQQITSNSRWHIMFHELSVNKEESLKFRFWAFLQIDIIKRLLKLLNPAVIATNTAIYKMRLEVMGYTVKLLPLFSNIARLDNRNGFTAKDIPAWLPDNRERYIVATLFGSFSFKSWDLHSLLNKFSDGHTGKKLVVVSLGLMSFGEEYWKQLQSQYPGILFLTLGIQDAGFISGWLSNYTDIGILTTLPELASKSGSFMAFKEHGVPVVCRERTAELRNYNIPLDEALTEVSEDKPFVLPNRYTPIAVLQVVMQQFINDLG